MNDQYLKMGYNVTDTPERWAILKLPDNFYKVFGTWAGGYLGRDSWRLNSGIRKMEEDEHFYYFFGFSGSCYQCRKGSYGISSSYGQSVLNEILNRGNGEIELLKDVKEMEL